MLGAMIYTSRKRSNQRDRLLALLKSRAPGRVPLRDVMEVAGAQYNARVWELRCLGYRIANEREDDHSFFRLVTRPTPTHPATPAPEADRLFPDDAPLPHRDLG